MAPTKTAVPTAVRKTCELCRMRKIKCDHELPCGQCIRRGRPDLCHYNRRAGKRAAKSAASARGAPLSESTNSLSAAERTDWPVPTTLNLSCHQNATTLGMRDDAFDTQQASDQTTRNPYFGANSLSDFLDDGSSAKTSSQYAASQGVRDAMMPMLGVATQVSGYPFYTPSEDAERQAIARLCRLLPSNKDIIKLFRVYQLEVHPYMPMLSNLHSFEAELCDYVQQYSSAQSRIRLSPEAQVQHTLRGKSMAWISVLFSLLACGTQFCSDPSSERQKTSNIYLTCAFESLQLGNFLMRPTYLCVQALLLIGNILQNDMQPQAAWTLLGMTIRAAQGLGLHKTGDDQSPQRLLWLALVRQDSLLALCFDRMTPSTMGALNLVTSTSGDLSHQSAMDHLADLTLRRGCISTEVSSESLRLRSSFADDIEFIKSRAPASPVDTSKAVNIQQRCEMYHLTLQFAFVKAWVCRPALRKVTLPESTEQLRLHLVNLCLQSLRECLYAFVSLQALSSYATRSWSVIHNGLSSALLLALMGEARNDAPLQQAFEDLLAMFQDHQSSADDGPPVRCETSTLSAVHSRAVVILQKMCASEDGSRYMLGRPDPAFDYTGGSGESQAQETSGPLQFHSNPVNPETTENADPYRTSLFETEPSLADLPPLDAFDSIWSFDGLVDPFQGNGGSLLWS